MSTLSIGFYRFVLLGVGLTTLAAAPRQVVHSQQSPVKDHQLFVGLDLVLNHEDALVNVRKIENKKALLDNSAREVISLRGSGGLQWRLATKVSATSAKIDGFKSKRVLSPRKNPVLKQLRDKQALLAYADHKKESRSTALLNSMRTESSDAAVFLAGGVAVGGSPDEDGLEDALGGELFALVDQMTEIGKSFDHATDSQHSKKGFDAVQLSFDISSPTLIADAYVVAILRITVDGDIHDTSFYRQIGRVDENPRKVKFMQTGLPSDFEIQDAKVHLYWKGEEIPTNFSEKNYSITSTEAKTFLQMDHLGQHRFDSAAAKPAWSMVPPALLAAQNSAEFDLPVTIELDAEGQLLAIQSSNVIVPENVRAVVEQMTFLPAVERGQGVASTLTVNPAEFFKIN